MFNKKYTTMKSLNMIIAIATVTLAAVSCKTNSEQQQEVDKQDVPQILVLYYSQTSNTKAVAEEIAKKLDADIEEIVAVNPYDGDFKMTIDRCIREQEEGITPEIKPIVADVNKYDIIFIGYPVWFGTYAPPVAAFLDSVDLCGKKLVPFCTFGSGGLESSAADLAKAEPKAEIISGYGVRAARLDAMPKEVDNFLKTNGFIDGEYIKLDEFPEQHPVTDEESSIFDTAVDGYPMIHAKAKSVASRNIPDGIEYEFTAVNTNEDGKNSSEIIVYVTVAKGEAPVFTNVIR